MSDLPVRPPRRVLLYKGTRLNVLPNETIEQALARHAELIPELTNAVAELQGEDDGRQIFEAGPRRKVAAQPTQVHKVATAQGARG